MRELEWFPVNSDTVEKVAYVPEYKDLLVTFRKGGEYVYHEVPDSLVKKLRGKRHVWSKVRDEITLLPFERLGMIRREPLKGRGSNKTLYGKAVASTTPKVTRARRTSTKAAGK